MHVRGGEITILVGGRNIKKNSMWKIRKIAWGIRNLIYYFRVVWNDRDWDYAFIEILLMHKLQKTYKRYHSVKYMKNQGQFVTKPLRICVEILQRQDDGFYYMVDNWMDKHNGIGIPDLAEDRDRRVLCNIINKYLPYWWD